MDRTEQAALLSAGDEDEIRFIGMMAAAASPAQHAAARC